MSIAATLAARDDVAGQRRDRVSGGVRVVPGSTTCPSLPFARRRPSSCSRRPLPAVARRRLRVRRHARDRGHVVPAARTTTACWSTWTTPRVRVEAPAARPCAVSAHRRLPQRLVHPRLGHRPGRRAGCRRRPRRHRPAQPALPRAEPYLEPDQPVASAPGRRGRAQAAAWGSAPAATGWTVYSSRGTRGHARPAPAGSLTNATSSPTRRPAGPSCPGGDLVVDRHRRKSVVGFTPARTSHRPRPLGSRARAARRAVG